MKIKKLLLIAIQLIIIVMPRCFAQDTPPEVCSVKHYLPVNNPQLSNIDIIGQDANNNMLFANMYIGKGISKYDGTTWTQLSEPDPLTSSIIYTIYNDSKKNTWIGTNDGISMYDGTEWHKFPLTQFSERGVMSIAEDKNGKMWFFYYNYAFTYDGKVWDKIVFNINDWLYDPYFDNDNKLWARGNSCIYRIVGTTISKFAQNEGLNSIYISKMSVIDGQIYCLYYNSDSISKFENEKWTNIPSPGSQNAGFKNIIKDASGRIWLMNNGGGLFRKDESGWKKYINIGIWGITSMYLDRDGILWFGSSSGQVVKYDSEGPTLVTRKNNDGIAFVYVSKMFVDKDNRLWVIPGQANTGISLFNGKKWNNTDHQFSYYTSFALDKNKDLYVCGGFIYKYNGTGWDFFSEQLGPNYNDTRALMFDKKNNMWFATGTKKVVKISGGSAVEFSVSDGILDNDIKKIIQDRDSNIWVIYGNYQNKVSKYNGILWETIELPKPDGYFVDYNNAVCDTAGNLWFASGIGLVKYDRITKKFKTYNSHNSSMAFDIVQDIAIDKNNNLWLSGQNPSHIITRLAISSGTFKNYSVLNPKYQQFPTIVLDNNNDIFIGDYYSGLYKVSFSATLPDVVKTDIVCTGAADGTLKLRPKNDLPYQYSIDNGKTFRSDTVYTSLNAGSYALIAKNGSCLSEAETVEIIQPMGKFDVAKKDITCFGNSDGAITITTEGLTNIQYNWSNGASTPSLSNLTKGTYTVTVSHSGTCNFQRQFEITEPEALSVVDSLFNSCGTYKGAIFLNVKGGVEPYTYLWSNGQTTKNIENLEPGTYKVTITADPNCPSIEKTFAVESFTGIVAKDIISSNKEYLCSGSASIVTSTNYELYRWFLGNAGLNKITNNITVTDPGVYKVMVRNANKCYAYDSIKILPKSSFETPQICLVTVDETTGKNKIIWNKFRADSLVKVIIEKESNQSGVYIEIGNVNSYNNGIYIDEASNPSVKAERYRIKVSDECNVKSLPGNIHKTIHLTASVGSNKEVNLVWSGYEGFTFGSYNIYRGSSKTNMTQIATIQNNLNSYSDINPPQGGLYYMLEAISPNVCNPDAFKSGNASTRSNFADNGATSTLKVHNLNSNIQVYPNPSSGNILVTFENKFSENVSIKLIDMTGKVVFFNKEVPGSSIHIERNNIPAGLYNLVIEGKELFRTKVIFQ